MGRRPTVDSEWTDIDFDDTGEQSNLLNSDDDDVVIETDPAASTVTVYARTPGGFRDRSYLLRLHLDEVFGAVAAEEDERLRAAQRREDEAIGFRKLEMAPVPRAPDARWELFRKFGPDGARRVHQSDLVGHLPATRTLVVVPDEIESIVHSARLLLSHGWEEWAFFSAPATFRASTTTTCPLSGKPLRPVLAPGA